MRKLTFIAFLCTLLLVSCNQEDRLDASSTANKSGISFKLQKDEYEGNSSRSSEVEASPYDELHYFIVDENGDKITSIKSYYDAATSKIYVEGLHKGDYRLLVLGIKGNATEDKAVISTPGHIQDEWLTFPEDLQKPLEAEYFYSQTPFSIIEEQTADGIKEVASIPGEITQKRIVSRVDFDFAYRNPYVRNAVTDKNLSFGNVQFYTTLSGNGELSGESNGTLDPVSLNQKTSYFFMPVCSGSSLNGNITISTRNYRKEERRQVYGFEHTTLNGNHIHHIETTVTHPDDKDIMMFITPAAYDAGGHKAILQDDETKDVYTNPSLRKFNTT